MRGVVGVVRVERRMLAVVWRGFVEVFELVIFWEMAC